MYHGRGLLLAFLVFCAGCALVANSWRSLRQREGMYDAQSTQVMQLTGWLALGFGLLLAALGAFGVVSAFLHMLT